MTPSPAVSSSSPASVSWIQVSLVVLPFFLNDFANILLGDARWWLLQDYAIRIAALVYLWRLQRRGNSPLASCWSLGPSRVAFLQWTLIAVGIGLFMVPGPGRLLNDLMWETRLGSIPAIPNGWMKTVDLTFGLVLVAVSEELVFRGYLQPVLICAFRSKVAGVLAAAAAFGLAHWSMGAGSVLNSTLVGVVFGLCVLGARSLVSVIVAHFLADFFVFLYL